MKLILFLLVLFVLYRLAFQYVPYWVRFLLKKTEQRDRGLQKEEAHKMIPCFTCGTYVSQSAALLKSGKYFCGEKCQKP